MKPPAWVHVLSNHTWYINILQSWKEARNASSFYKGSPLTAAYLPFSAGDFLGPFLISQAVHFLLSMHTYLY